MKYRKPIPFKFVAVLLLVLIGLFVAVLYFMVPSVALSLNSTWATSYIQLYAFGMWLLTTQFIIGAAVTGSIIMLIVARKYIFAKKITVIQPATIPRVQDQLRDDGLFAQDAARKAAERAAAAQAAATEGS